MKKLNILLEENIIKTNEDIYRNMLSAYSEEINAWYFYIFSKIYLIGKENKQVEELFEETAKDELEDHAYWLLKRFDELGYNVEPINSLANLDSIALHKYIKPKFNNNGDIDTLDILEKAKQSELDAINTYENLITLTERIDPVSNLKFKEILGDEQEHLNKIETVIKSIKNI